jgi:hypothetical protein
VKNIAWLVLALSLLAACSSEKTASTEAAPAAGAPSGIATPTSNVSVPPADPAWSTKQAANGYRDAIGGVTDELTKLSRMSPKATLTKTRVALRGYSQASTTAVEKLLKGKWDTEAAPAVNTLIAALLDQQQYFDSLANEASTDSIRAQSQNTAKTLLVTRYWSAELEKKLGVSDGLLDPTSPGAGTP